MSKLPPLRGEISNLQATRSPFVLSDLSVTHMSINNCSIFLAPRLEQRATVRDVAIFQCEHYANDVNGARLQDVIVTDVRGSSKAPTFLCGCVYSHVTLRGRMGGVWFSPLADTLADPLDGPLNRAYLAANAAEYRTVDWALDITEAQFSHFFSLDGIPASLVRRRPDRHFVLTREAAQVLAKEAVPTVWTGSAQRLLELGLPDTVLVAEGSPKLRRTYLHEAERLRDRGLIV